MHDGKRGWPQTSNIGGKVFGSGELRDTHTILPADSPGSKWTRLCAVRDYGDASFLLTSPFMDVLCSFIAFSGICILFLFKSATVIHGKIQCVSAR